MSNPKVLSDMKAVESLNWMYHLHFLRGEYDMIDKLTTRFSESFSSDYGHYLKGIISLRRGDASSALTILNSINRNSDVTIVKSVTRCLVLLGRHQTVCDVVREKNMIASPTDWQVLYMIGLSFFHAGNLSLAKDAFQRAIQSSINRSDPYLMLARCHQSEGDVKSAIFVLRKASEMCSEDTNVIVKLGTLLVANGMISKGNEKILQLQHLSTITQGNLSMSLAVGAVLQESRRDIDGALYRYKMANTFESHALWNNIGLCFASRKKVVGAMSCLKRAHYLNPLDWRISYNLALLHIQMKQFASAFHFLKSSAASSGGAPHVVSFLATCLECLGDMVNAKQAHSTAAKSAMTINFPNPILNFAVFLYHQGKEVNREEIISIIGEFEKSWVKRRETNGQFDDDVMRLATKLATEMDVSQHMAWIRSSADDVPTIRNVSDVPSSLDTESG